VSDNGRALVHCKTDGGICDLVMENPGRSNALSFQLLADLADQLENAREKNARVVILSGAGKKFSAGGDFNDLKGTIDDLAIDDAIEKVVDAIRGIPAPVIAAVEGPCLGGAVDIALACDLLVAGESAFFEVPAARLGLLYNPRAVLRWRKRLSGLALRRLLLAGERFAADAAVAAGVVSHRAPTGSATARAHDLAAEILQGTPAAVAATKAMLLAIESDEESDEINLERWDELRREILASPERKAAVTEAKQPKPT
jgi:enoyl-CoA hydratase/carnithine racemase